MPYLTKSRKEYLVKFHETPESEGELNFLITRLCLDYLKHSEGKYTDYNAIVGALESAKLEFYARAVRKYEDQKIIENGDVYEPPIGLVLEGNNSDI